MLVSVASSGERILVPPLPGWKSPSSQSKAMPYGWASPPRRT